MPTSNKDCSASSKSKTANSRINNKPKSSKKPISWTPLTKSVFQTPKKSQSMPNQFIITSENTRKSILLNSAILKISRKI